MIRINLLKCFPHRFTKHYDYITKRTHSTCMRCMKTYETEADYRTPKQKWYESIDRLTSRMGL